jgi:hypothetical protein
MSFLVFSDIDFRPGCELATCGAVLLFFSASAAIADDAPDAESTTPGSTGMPFETVPDIRDDKVPLKVQNGDFVAVPIPMSNPTLGTGLMGGAAYFYPQTEEQKKKQAASMTGIGGLYTDNESWVAGIAQQSYWDEDKWRLHAIAGYARPPRARQDSTGASKAVSSRESCRGGSRIHGTWASCCVTWTSRRTWRLQFQQKTPISKARLSLPAPA